MDNLLDITNGIPYYTKSSDQIFSWYTIYNDNAIILEINDYSTVNFKNIPKTNIKYFGLFGCGFHLNINIKDLSLNIYTAYKDKEFSYTCKYNLNNSILSNTSNITYTYIQPFQFKGFIYDIPIRNVCKEKILINSYYLGINSKVLIENKEILNKIYFSIDTINHPYSIGLIYKLIPIQQTIYPNKKYRLNIAEEVLTNLYGSYNKKENIKSSIINLNNIKSIYKYKTIFSYTKST